jgi:hypothetical protein
MLLRARPGFSRDDTERGVAVVRQPALRSDARSAVAARIVKQSQEQLQEPGHETNA